MPRVLDQIKLDPGLDLQEFIIGEREYEMNIDIFQIYFVCICVYIYLQTYLWYVYNRNLDN